MHARRRRAQGAIGVVWLLLGGLAFTFFYAQVLRSPAYGMRSDRNRLRPLTVPASRGTIRDRAGRIVAHNVSGYTVSLLPAPADSVRGPLERLAALLELSDDHVATLLDRQRRAPQRQLVVSTDVPSDLISTIEERRPLYPGVLVERRPTRRYPAGSAAAHLVGYVGEIGERQLDTAALRGLRAGQMVGKAGVERQYERRLAGRPGVRYVEMDALGRIIDDFTREGELLPIPGEPLQLSIDLELQEWLTRIVPDTKRGAVAALDPATGAVLALYSSPSFDPNELVGVVPRERWVTLQQDSANPLLNRAIEGTYPPGSTWKLATAAIALDLGIIDPEGYLPLACRGGMRYGGRYFRCWDASGHGYLDLADAVKHSCAVYFYQVGLQIGLARLLEEGTRLGFGDPTGVDLPSERAGTFPGDPGWYQRRFGWPPTEAEVLNIAIGQGATEQTALRMAQFFVALATDGRAPPPRIALNIDDAGGDTLDLRITPRDLEWLREGLRRATEEGGTAAGSRLEHWAWSGKTGTAPSPHGPDHGWFVGIAGPPGGDAEVVVSAIMEAGENGSDVAQIAAKTADYYLRKRHDMPIDTIQTLREHLNAGLPAPWGTR